MTEGEAFVRVICENPADDLPRLVYADWLQEHGQLERAEFIRVQCELAAIGDFDFTARNVVLGHRCYAYTERERLRRRERELWKAHWSAWTAPIGSFAPCARLDNCGTSYVHRLEPNRAAFIESRHRRGFVDEVALTAAAFLGRPCGGCGGDGLARDNKEWGCLGCGGNGHMPGTGRTTGIAGDLFRAHPVTAVRLTDREPAETISGREWVWVWPDTLRELHEVPEPLMRHVRGRNGLMSYSSRDSAFSAMSAAAVAHGRALADLSPLDAPAPAGGGVR